MMLYIQSDAGSWKPLALEIGESATIELVELVELPHQ